MAKDQSISAHSVFHIKAHGVSVKAPKGILPVGGDSFYKNAQRRIG